MRGHKISGILGIIFPPFIPHPFSPIPPPKNENLQTAFPSRQDGQLFRTEISGKDGQLFRTEISRKYGQLLYSGHHLLFYCNRFFVVVKTFMLIVCTICTVCTCLLFIISTVYMFVIYYQHSVHVCYLLSAQCTCLLFIISTVYMFVIYYQHSVHVCYLLSAQCTCLLFIISTVYMFVIYY